MRLAVLSALLAFGPAAAAQEEPDIRTPENALAEQWASAVGNAFATTRALAEAAEAAEDGAGAPGGPTPGKTTPADRALVDAATDAAAALAHLSDAAFLSVSLAAPVDRDRVLALTEAPVRELEALLLDAVEQTTDAALRGAGRAGGPTWERLADQIDAAALRLADATGVTVVDEE